MISPLPANICLNKLDRIWASRCGELGAMDRLGLTLHPAKTRMVDWRRGKESFVFLGYTIRKKRSIQRAPGKHSMHRRPSPKAMKKLRDRVRELTSKRHMRN